MPTVTAVRSSPAPGEKGAARATGSRRSGGTLSVLSGTAAGQALVIASMPVLTRLYSVRDLAVLAVFTSLVGLLAPVAALRLEAAVPLPDGDRDAAALAWSGFVSAGLFGGVVAVAGLAVGAPVSRLLGVPGLGGQWLSLGLAVTAMGLFQITSAWMIRTRRYRALGIRDCAVGVGQVATQVGLGVAGASAIGLTLGMGLGRLAGLGGLLCGGGLVRRPAGPRRMAAAVSRYRRFPLVASWSALLNTAGTYTPVLMIAAAYGDHTVALVGLTIRALSAPSALITAAVAQVFQGEAAAVVRERAPRLRGLVLATVRRLLLLGAGPTAVVLLLGPALFGLVFGQTWVLAGTFGSIMGIGYLARFAVAAVSHTLLILERQGQQLRWDASRLALTLGAMTICLAGHAPATVTVGVLTATQVVGYGALLVSCLRAAGAHDRDVAGAS
ncbi:MAG: oligosaccharide flippase family protein [Dactylosporangium sp.]|nr:oligosaccharide flippase family protein [Dactylosporangium sp.]